MRREGGFTLIELLLVILLIGILAAIAIPAFLGQRDKGHDADAKSNAANVRVRVEACATHAENGYTDCATAAQIEANGLPVGGLNLPPLNQYAAAGGNGNGNGNGNGGGPQNGAQCIIQSNGVRACTQTDPGGGGSGGTTTDPGGGGTTTTTDPGGGGTTTTGTTTTDTTSGDAPPDTEVGGAAPDVGDCVEGGTIERGCVGIVASSSGYTITAVSRAGHTFRIVKTNERVTRPCEPAGSGGCPSSGSW